MVDAVLVKPIREQSLLDAFDRLFGTPNTVQVVAPTGTHDRVLRPEAVIPSLKILVAEDNKINQQFALMLLRNAGHAVEIIENGELAVDAVRRGTYDVVLMDVQMHVLDGIQATKQIRDLPPSKNAVPIIALTAHAMAGVGD